MNAASRGLVPRPPIQFCSVRINSGETLFGRAFEQCPVNVEQVLETESAPLGADRDCLSIALTLPSTARAVASAATGS